MIQEISMTGKFLFCCLAGGARTTTSSSAAAKRTSRILVLFFFVAAVKESCSPGSPSLRKIGCNDDFLFSLYRTLYQSVDPLLPPAESTRSLCRVIGEGPQIHGLRTCCGNSNTPFAAYKTWGNPPRSDGPEETHSTCAKVLFPSVSPPAVQRDAPALDGRNREPAGGPRVGIDQFLNFCRLDHFKKNTIRLILVNSWHLICQLPYALAIAEPQQAVFSRNPL